MMIYDAGGKAFLVKDGKVYVFKRGKFREVEVGDEAPPVLNIGGGDDEKD